MAQKESIFEQTIRDFVKAVGGSSNIKNAFNCASRFRFTVNDKSKVKIDLLKKVHLSKGLNISGEQYQLIFGPGTVNKVMDYYTKIVVNGKSDGSNSQSSSPTSNQSFGQKKPSLWNKDLPFSTNFFNTLRKVIRDFANIFIPLIPIFIAGGFCLAAKTLMQSINPSNTGAMEDLEQFFNITGGMIFSALPIFCGFTSAKIWGGNPWFGAAIGAVLISPDIINSWSLQANGFVYVPFGAHAEHTDKVIALLKQISDSDNWMDARNIFIQQFGEKLGEGYWAKLSDAIQNGGISEELWKEFSSWKLDFDSSKTFASLLDGVKEVTVLFSSFPFFSIKLIGYQAQVFTIILVNIFAVNLEKLLKRVVPDSLSLIVSPFLTLSLSIWAAFWAIGPFGRWLSNGIAFVFSSLFKYTNYGYGIGLGGALLAFFYSPLVMTGLHQGLLPVKATIVSLQGVDYTTPIEICSNCSQGIAALVLLLFIVKSKKELRSQVISGGLSGNWGITEPAIFGVTIQCKHAFFAGMIGAACGGWWVGMTQTLANTIGISSWFGLVQFEFYKPTQAILNWWGSLNWTPLFQNIAPMFNELIAVLLATCVTALMTIILSTTNYGKKQIAEFTQTNEQTKFAKWIDKLLRKNKNSSTAAPAKAVESKKEVKSKHKTSINKNMFVLPNVIRRGF